MYDAPDRAAPPFSESETVPDGRHMTTDTSERGLERLICTALTGHACDPPKAGEIREPRVYYGGVGWTAGDPRDYDRDYCVDLVQLSAFLRATQPEAAERLSLNEDSPTRRKFLARLQGEITRRGTIDVLRNGVKHGAHELELLYGTPSTENVRAQHLFNENRFTVSRQLRYSKDQDPTGTGHRVVHQRPAGDDVRTEEQPHQADRRRRGRAVQEGPQSAREAVRTRPLRGPLRGGREGRALLHSAPGQGLLVPALQPRLERWRRQSSEPEWTGGRLPVARGAGPQEPHEHHRELRPGHRVEGREVRQEEEDPDLAALPPARRGAAAIGRRGGQRRRRALPDPALGRQREEQLDRLAGAPTDRA